MINKLFTAWKKEDRDQEVISFQQKCIYLLGIICIGCVLGWIRSPSHMTVYIPPDISNGITLKPNVISDPMVYSFAYEVWQEVNYWPQNGLKDYAQNIHTYWSYLTPSFKSQLLQDLDDLKATGQLDRERWMQGMNGAAYEASSVKKLSGNSWEVDITMRLMEYNNNQAVKDVDVLYPLKVVRRAISQHYNPYGLQLAGFIRPPVRLKTVI